MRATTGTLPDLTTALNAAIAECINCGVNPAAGTLVSATAQLNALLTWSHFGIAAATGTLASATAQYNLFVPAYYAATWEYRYQVLSKALPRDDGTGRIILGLEAVQRILGTTTAFYLMAARHRDVLCPAADILAALASGTNSQKTAAIKAVIVNYVDAPIPIAPSDWTASGLQNYTQANNQSIKAADNLDFFITVTLGQTYPVQFTL